MNITLISKAKKIIFGFFVLGLIAYGLYSQDMINIFPVKAVDCTTVPKTENATVIRMDNKKFDPDNLTVNVCDTLLFLNLEDEEKWPKSSEFDAGHAMPKFDFFQYQVTRTGTYSFYDHLHEQ